VAIFKRAATWGEGHPLPATWGTVYAVWTGYLISQSEMVHLGTILLDATPSANVLLDATPSQPIRLDLTPSEDIWAVLAPAKTIYMDLTPEATVTLEAGWGVSPIEDVASGTDYDNMLFVAVHGHGNDVLGFWVNVIGNTTAEDDSYDDTLTAQVFD